MLAVGQKFKGAKCHMWHGGAPPGVLRNFAVSQEGGGRDESCTEVLGASRGLRCQTHITRPSSELGWGRRTHLRGGSLSV